MRKILCATALTLALCCNALAGEIPTPPAPQPHAAAQEPTDGGEISTTPEDTLTKMAIDLLAALSSLF